MTQLEKSLSQDIEKLKKKCTELESENRYLNEKVNVLNSKFFGRKSEKTSVIFNADQLNLFNEAETEAKASSPEPETNEVAVSGHKRRKKQQGHQQEILKSMPHEKVVFDVAPEDQICSRCGEKLIPLGEKLIRTEVEFIPSKLRVIDFYQKSYQCEPCRKNDHFSIEKGILPKPVLPHSVASASSIANVIHQKYELAVPLYRQEKEWANMGLELSRATMANWLIVSQRYYLAPLVSRMKELLLTEDILHADETTVQVLNEKNRSNTSISYMWLYCSGIFESKHNIRIFEYQPGRKGDFAKEFLKDFKGYLIHDQYAGYNKIQDVSHCLCGAHLRRYFVEASSCGEKADPNTVAGQGLLKLNQIFAIEAELKEVTAAERKKQRLEKEKELIEAFFAWAEINRAIVPSQSRIGKALDYAIRGKKSYMTYLEDGRINFTNSIAENAIRPFAVGRKNWLFSASPKGASASAGIYSLIETCKANDVDPYRYFVYILRRMPNEPFQLQPKLLDDYLPWSQAVQNNCK